MTFRSSSSSQTTAAGKSIPPACSSAKRAAASPPGAVALAAAVAGCQRGPRPDHRPPVGLWALGRLVAGVGALAFSGPAAFSHPRERGDVGDTGHSRCGRRPSQFGINQGRKRRSRQSARLVGARIARSRWRARASSRVSARGSRFAAELAQTTICLEPVPPHGLVASGRLFGSTAAPPPRRLARLRSRPLTWRR